MYQYLVFWLGGRLLVGNKRPLVMYTDVLYIIGEGAVSTTTSGLRIHEAFFMYKPAETKYFLPSPSYIQSISLLVICRGVSCHCTRRYLPLKSLEATSEIL